MKEKKYKGIVIFGAPGSGKTAIAKLLLSSFFSSKYIEASSTVIESALSIKDKLPKDENVFIQKINKIYKDKVNIKINHEEARNFFTHLKNRYSSSIVAKTIIHIHKKRFPKNFIIIAGIRGYRNSIYFKKNGYFVVYLKIPDRHLSSRLSKREDFTKKEAEREIEERLFSTNKVEKIAHISLNTAIVSKKEIIEKIKTLIHVIECKRCVNTSINLSSTFNNNGLCDVCEIYEKNFDEKILEKEFKFLMTLKNSGEDKYDAMVGISGGKDSTATLYEIKKLGFNPLSFSLDTSYYPKHIFIRAKRIAKEMNVDYQKIDARVYMRRVDSACFKRTAELYDEHDSLELKEKFRKWYIEGRRHYSIKCSHKIPFVRTCQLCRRIIIRSYYGEAQKHGVRLIVLGINEWAGLSQDSESKKFVFSSIRKLQPFKNKPPVYIVHLPFLLQRKIKDTEKILRKLGWKIPRGERLIESNSNSCLFAKAAENKARRMLGFHPDSTRLSREVTVGFISKKQAKQALEKIHYYNKSVRQVLKEAKII